MPELSVVIPTYDTAAMTLRCCRAVLASMPDGTEVIVADDGSRDGTAEVLAREVPGVRVVRLDENRGFATAANRGVAAASGRVIVLLNSDAIVDSHALQHFLDAFASDAKLGVAGAQLLNEDGTPQWSGGRTPTLAWIAGVVSGAGHLARTFRKRRDGDSPREVDWVSGAAMAFRAKVWRDAGPLNERFRFYCQDIELCLRARDAGWDVRIVPEARIVHGLGKTIARGDGLTHDPEKLWPDLLTWGRSRYGIAWSLLARFVLFGVALLRVARHPANPKLRRAARALLQSDS